MHLYNTDAGAVEADLLDEVAFCIKTFLREDCLFRLIESVLVYYPKAHIYIADDGSLSRKKLLKYAEWEEKGIHIFLLPFDVGLSAGRNFLVDKSTEKYLLFLDDDFVFTAETKLEIFYNIVSRNSQICLVGGSCITNGVVTRYDGGVEIRDGILTYYTDSDENWTKEDTFRWRYTDRVFNFFLSRRELFSKVKWDPEFKVAEHISFFLSIKQLSLSDPNFCVAYTDSVSVDHVTPLMDKVYKAFRRREDEILPLFMEKMKITGFRHENRNVGTMEKIRAKFLKDETTNSEKIDEFMQKSMEDAGI